MSDGFNDFLQELEREIAKHTTEGAEEPLTLAKALASVLAQLTIFQDYDTRLEASQDIIIGELRGLRKDLDKLGGIIARTGEDVVEYGLLPVRDAIRDQSVPVWVSDGTVRDEAWEYLRERLGGFERKKVAVPSDEDVDRVLGEGD